MIPLSSIPKGDELFAWADQSRDRRWLFHVTGMNRHFDSDPGDLEIISTPFVAAFMAHVLADRGVDDSRLAAIPDKVMNRPVLAVRMDTGSCLLVDGHHRLVRLYAAGAESYTVAVFPLGTWDRFLIDTRR